MKKLGFLYRWEWKEPREILPLDFIDDVDSVSQPRAKVQFPSVPPWWNQKLMSWAQESLNLVIFSDNTSVSKFEVQIKESAAGDGDIFKNGTRKFSSNQSLTLRVLRKTSKLGEVGMKMSYKKFEEFSSITPSETLTW